MLGRSKALTLEDLPDPAPENSRYPWTEATPLLPERMPDGSTWTRITVVTPSYNQGQFIEETIRSVLLQGYPNLEYIIIDGGSTDNSVEIIQKYQQHLAYWVSEADDGPADAINKGWSRATGEIIAYLNSDDLYLPGTLATIAQRFQQHPNTFAICGNEFAIDAEGMILHQSNISQISHDSLIGLNFIPQPAMFLRRSALEAIGNLDLNVKYIFDFELWLRFTRIYPIESIADVLAITRWHDQTITLRQRVAIAKELARYVTREIKYFSPHLPVPEKRRLLLQLYCFVVNLHLERNRLVDSMRYAAIALWITRFRNPEIIKLYVRFFRGKIARWLPQRSYPKTLAEEPNRLHWSQIAALKSTARSTQPLENRS